jgi:hypothetical protein
MSNRREEAMILNKMYVEKWAGTREKGQMISSPSWDNVEAAIRGLDGKTKTSVFLYVTEDRLMGIGGGNNGLYTVMIDAPEFVAAQNLVEPSKSGKEIMLVVGGQSAGYPERMCVDLSRVLQAARTFAEAGQAEGSLSWEE